MTMARWCALVDGGGDDLSSGMEGEGTVVGACGWMWGWRQRQRRLALVDGGGGHLSLGEEV